MEAFTYIYKMITIISSQGRNILYPVYIILVMSFAVTNLLCYFYQICNHCLFLLLKIYVVSTSLFCVFILCCAPVYIVYLFCVVHQSIFLYIDMHLVPTQLLLASYSAPDLSDCVDIENKGMFLCSGSRYLFSRHYVLVFWIP